MPLPFAVALPITPGPTRVTVTVLLASAVPFSTKVVSLVIRSLLEDPVSVVIPVKLGSPGADVSMVTLRAPDATLVLPARSVALAVML